MRKITSIILSLATVIALVSCSKTVSFDTTYVVKPLMQPFSSAPNEPIEGVTAFAFAADTTEWTVATYDDALKGILTSRLTPTQQLPEAVATSTPHEREGTVGWVQMDVSAPSLMILVVDPVNKLYAYTQQPFVENLPMLYVTIIFKPWKEGLHYKDGNWEFYNEFYTPPTLLKCNIAPTVQIEQDGAEQPITDVKIYAYALDTLQWRLTSYQDALNGKVVSKDDPTITQTTPTYQAFKDEATSLYAMTVSATPLMIVVVDRVHKMYAYTKQVPDLKGDSPTYPILFRPWLKSYSTLEDGWHVVDEQYLPKTN